MTKSEESTRDVYQLSEKERIEFNRRLAIVRARLKSLMLKRQNREASADNIINCLYVLVQEPMLIYLYHEVNGELLLVRYYDHERALQGRREIELLCYPDGEIKVELPISVSDGERLFRVFNTSFYLRVFRYCDDDKQADFYETPPWPIDAIQQKAEISDDNKLTKTQIEADHDLHRYISVCVEALLGGKPIAGVIDEPSMTHIANWVFEVFKTTEKSPVGKRGYRNSRLVPIKDRKLVEQFADSLQEEFLSANKGLDRIQHRAGAAAGRIKLLANEREQGDDIDYPNMVWLFRSFDRGTLRSVSSESAGARKEDKQSTHGYDYNLRFVLTEHQAEGAARYLYAHYVTKIGISPAANPDVEVEERYGDWLESSGDHAWLFNFAQQVDKAFWTRFASSDNEKIRIDRLREIFDQPFGDGAVSFADTVFHGGLIQVRAPFRRYAGLDRIKEVFDAMRGVGIQDFSTLSHEVQRDCLRIVAAYYLFGGCGQLRVKTRKNYRTRLVLFPISVLQVTVGVMACVVFEQHGTGKKKDLVEVPRRLDEVPSKHWEMVYHFYRDVYTPVQRDVRRLYRDMQILLLQKQLVERTWDVLMEALVSGFINGPRMEQMSADLTNYGKVMSRFIPYPVTRFSYHEDKKADSRSIRFDDLFRIELNNEGADSANKFFRINRDEAKGHTSSEYGVLDLYVAQMRLQEVFQSQIEQFLRTQRAWDEKSQPSKIN